MSAHVLVSGTIFRTPEQRTSKAGKPFWTTTIRAKGDDASEWWKVIVFSETAGAELMRLAAGDAVSAQGTLKVEQYDKDGETKLSLTVFAENILALRQPPKQRAKKDPAPASESRHIRRRAEPEQSGFRTHGDSGDDRFGDEIPF